MANNDRKLIVITGGSRGIGRMCVHAFAKKGWRVLFTYCTHYIDAKTIVESYSVGTVSTIQFDQVVNEEQHKNSEGDFRSIKNLALEVDKWREGKPIDGLINNAALGSGSVGKYIADRTAETSSLPGGASTVVFLPQQELEDETLMRVNALGPKWVTEALLPAMMRKSGEGSSLWRSVVLFVGSVGASEVHKGFRVADVMSKAALIRGAKQMANIHAHDSIDIMCISPGATNTDMLNTSLRRFMNDIQLESFVKGLPKGNLIDAENIASAIYWLISSPASRIFHGANLDASQGLAVCPETAQFPAPSQ